MKMGNAYRITKSAALDFVNDNAMTLGAALAFYAALSMAPLLWIYYASLIFFFGAELTQTWAAFHGRRLQPEEHAQETPAGQEKRERQLQEAGR